MSRNLHQSTSILARTRNKLISLPFQLPEEVMSEIFMKVIYGYRSVDASKSLTMKDEVWLIYCRLYRVLGVCSAWRDILLARGTFWSVIPIISSPFDATGKWRPFELSLKRAGDSALHLAAETSTNFANASTYLNVLLAEYTPRFRTINIRTDDMKETQYAISRMLQHNTHGSLSELSIQCCNLQGGVEGLPEPSDHIVAPNSSQQTNFASLVCNLAAFRISGVCIPWDNLTFSTRLTELRIQDLTLGYDNAIIPFIQVLSSASNLRDLKIISVSTFRDFMAPHIIVLPPITFPLLQSLFIENLYLNTLEQLFPMLAPGSYHLTLYLSPNSVEINTLEHEPTDEPEGHGDLCRVLNHIPIDTLMISGLVHGRWLAAPNLANILKALPVLKTLKLEAWIFDKRFCKSLTRVGNARVPVGGHSLPSLQNLHLTTVDIRNQKSFKTMVRSYPLGQVIIGGQFLIDQSPGWSPLEEDSNVVQWLKWKMPDIDLQLVDMAYRPPEFYTNRWKLW